MRWKQIVAGAATLGIGLLLCGEAMDSIAAAAQPDEHQVPPSIEAVRELADLTVLEVQATEVVTHTIRGHIGGTTAVVLVVGTVTLGIDLEQARFGEIDHERMHLVLSLPPPIVRCVAVDHQASRVLSCHRSGLWELAIGEAKEDQVVADAFRIGEDRLRQAPVSRGDVSRARRHAESVITGFGSQLGWTLQVRWDE